MKKFIIGLSLLFAGTASAQNLQEGMRHIDSALNLLRSYQFPAVDTEVRNAQVTLQGAQAHARKAELMDLLNRARHDLNTNSLSDYSKANIVTQNLSLAKDALAQMIREYVPPRPPQGSDLVVAVRTLERVERDLRFNFDLRRVEYDLNQALRIVSLENRRLRDLDLRDAELSLSNALDFIRNSFNDRYGQPDPSRYLERLISDARFSIERSRYYDNRNPGYDTRPGNGYPDDRYGYPDDRYGRPGYPGDRFPGGGRIPRDRFDIRPR